MVERMLADFERSYDLRLVVFRFFNACGSNSESLLGEDNNPQAHMIPLVEISINDAWQWHQRHH